MKKKIVSTLLCTAMLVTMMAGCGGNNAANTSTNSGNSGNSSSADTSSSDAAATDEAAPATETASDASASLPISSVSCLIQPQTKLLRQPKQHLMQVLQMKEKYLTSTAGTKSLRAVLQIIIRDILRWMQPQVRSVM